MKILSLDPSKSNTGWAVWDIARHHSSMEVGSFKVVGDSLFEATDDFVAKLVPILKQFRPDHVVWEAGRADIQGYSRERNGLAGSHVERGGNAAILILQRLIGAAQTACNALHITHEEVDMKTWRKAFLGYGWKAGMTRDAYKKAARQQCEDEKISVSNNDQAEAAGIAFWAGRCSQIVRQKSKTREVA